MMTQNEGDTNTEGKGLVQDASETFLSPKFNVGIGSRLTDPTLPMARVGVEFYLATDLKTLKDRVFGEMESTAVKVDTAFQSIVNKMGDGAGLGASIRKNFTEAVSSVQLIGMDFKDVQTAAESTLEVFGRNVTLSGEEYKNLLSTQQVTGQNVKQLEEGFLNAGMSVKDITKEMYNVTQVANAIGVNARLVSANVVSNLDKLNRYGFQSGVEGLAKMAAKAAALRIDLTDTLSIADDLMDPEGAIELASTLQRLGTTSAALTDPLRLMDMAQNDVGALQEELANMFSTYAEFNEENQRFEILPSARRELKQLEKELGLPLGTIEKMAIGTKELDKKLSEISFSGFDVPQEAQELIANMSMMNEDGEYVIKYVDEEGKAREETTAEFLEEFGGDVEKMQKALGRQKEEDDKSIEDKMYDRAGETLSSMQKLEAYSKASADALGLATGGGEFGKQTLDINVAASKAINTGVIKELGPGSDIAKQFQEVANEQKDFLKIFKDERATKEQKQEAFQKVLDSYEKIADATLSSVGKAAIKVGKDVGAETGIKMPEISELSSKIEEYIKNLPSLGDVVGEVKKLLTPSDDFQKAFDNVLAPFRRSPSLGVTIDKVGPQYESFVTTKKSDETEGERIQVPNKSEEIPTEANLVQQTNDNITEINQTETQQTTNLGNQTNFNVLNEVFNTTNEELKDISVTNSSLLKTSTEAFDKSQSLITNTNTLLSSIQQSQTLVKTNNTVASTTTTTISPTAAAAATTTEPTVTKPETPKAEKTKETKIEVKKASKEDVGLFVQSPVVTGSLNEKGNENQNLFENKPSVLGKYVATGEIGKDKTMNLTNSFLPEFKIPEDRSSTNYFNQDLPKPEGVNLFENKPSVLGKYAATGQVPGDTTKLFKQEINNENLVSSNTLKEQSLIQMELNNQTNTRKDLVTMMSEKELQTFEDKKKEQVTFTNFLNKENEIRQESTKDIQKQKTTSLDNQTQEFIFGQQLNEQIIERDNYVTQFTEEEIRRLDEKREKELSFNESFEKEIENRRTNTENNLTQQSTITNTKKEEISVGRQLNEQMVERNEFVTMLSEKEISMIDQQNERQLSFNNLLNEENSIREEYVTKLQETEKDKSVTSVVSGGELTNVSETLSTVNKETVKNETKTVSEIARRIHERAKMIYDGVIDESEKGVATVINEAEALKTPPTTTDTTKKIENKNLFETEPSVLGKFVATGEVGDGKTTEIPKPLMSEFKIPEDNSVTNFVNQGLPKPTGVNLFDTKPSLLGQYTAGKTPEATTATIVNPEIPKQSTEGNIQSVATQTDFGFGQEIPISVAEFKGAEDVISQFFTPEAIAASPTPIAQTDVERVQELQKSTTSTQNINDNRTLDVTIKTPDIKDPTVAENYRKDVINILKGELPNMIERDKGLMDKMRANMTPNFGLTEAQTPGVQ